jgi:hypothetical protein
VGTGVEVFGANVAGLIESPAVALTAGVTLAATVALDPFVGVAVAPPDPLPHAAAPTATATSIAAAALSNLMSYPPHPLFGTAMTVGAPKRFPLT